ncbi:MAG: PrsW family intramembrane metalloprotease, partial [Planctomycetaceae bacterium]|nr:PrsW family intramembrane metalloprotease [Planctomycetaceae bacterium]
MPTWFRPHGSSMPIFLAVLVCAAVLALLIYRYDLYEKEPWPLLFLTLVVGGITGWLAGRIEDTILINLGERGNDVFTQAILASITEELFKLAVVLGVAFVFREEFNDPIDGLIYGAFAGLGAAVEESFFYIQLADNVGTALIGTELIRLLLHIFLGGLAGFGVGLARFRIPNWPGIF